MLTLLKSTLVPLKEINLPQLKSNENYEKLVHLFLGEDKKMDGSEIEPFFSVGSGTLSKLKESQWLRTILSDLEFQILETPA